MSEKQKIDPLKNPKDNEGKSFGDQVVDLEVPDHQVQNELLKSDFRAKMGSNFMEEELVREISGRRPYDLQKFSDFERKAIEKRHLLVKFGQLGRFLGTAAEFSQTVESLIETAENVTIRHNSEDLARVQKILNRLRAEVEAKRGNVVSLDKETAHLVKIDLFMAENIQKKFDEIRDLWEYLLNLLNLKWMSVEKELDSLEFARKCEFLLDWINKTKNLKPTGGQKVFHEIRKLSVVWNEISTVFQQLQDPSVKDQANFEKIREEWTEFQIFVDSLLKELDENERVQRFVENSEDVKAWIQEKETEILGKYSKMDVEEAMRYRKTIEILMKSMEQWIQELKNDLPELQKVKKPSSELQNHVDSVQERFENFQKFIEKWRFDLANAADLVRESEKILYWCAEKSEDLKVMKESDNDDLDEISMWIEANSFDFNSWDSVVKAFEMGAEKLLEKLVDPKLAEGLEKVRQQYTTAKETAESTNVTLELRVKTIGVEKLIFQTHQKAAHLVTMLQKIENDDQDEDRTTDELEKALRNHMMAERCESVVEQIEIVEKQITQKLKELADMKKILTNFWKEEEKISPPPPLVLHPAQNLNYEFLSEDDEDIDTSTL